MFAKVGPSVCPSVVLCPYRGHISNTKQDRPVVTIEHCIEVGTAAIRSSPDACVRGICDGQTDGQTSQRRLRPRFAFGVLR